MSSEVASLTKSHPVKGIAILEEENQDYAASLKENIKLAMMKQCVIRNVSQFKISDIKELFQTIHISHLETAARMLVTDGILLSPDEKSRTLIFHVNMTAAQTIIDRMREERERKRKGSEKAASNDDDSRKQKYRKVLKEGKENTSSNGKVKSSDKSPFAAAAEDDQYYYYFDSNDEEEEEASAQEMQIRVHTFEGASTSSKPKVSTSNIIIVRDIIKTIFDIDDEVSLDVVRERSIRNGIDELDFMPVIDYLLDKNSIYLDENIIYRL